MAKSRGEWEGAALKSRLPLTLGFLNESVHEWTEMIDWLRTVNMPIKCYLGSDISPKG